MISHLTITRQYGPQVLSYYGKSLYKALVDLFPEVSWKSTVQDDKSASN